MLVKWRFAGKKYIFMFLRIMFSDRGCTNEYPFGCYTWISVCVFLKTNTTYHIFLAFLSEQRFAQTVQILDMVKCSNPHKLCDIMTIHALILPAVYLDCRWRQNIEEWFLCPIERRGCNHVSILYSKLIVCKRRHHRDLNVTISEAPHPPPHLHDFKIIDGNGFKGSSWNQYVFLLWLELRYLIWFMRSCYPNSSGFLPSQCVNREKTIVTLN